MKYCHYGFLFVILFILSSPDSKCQDGNSSLAAFRNGSLISSNSSYPVKKEFYKAGAGGSWIKTSEQRFDFDKSDNDSVVTWLKMDDNILVNSRRELKFFDGQSRVTRDLVQTWKNDRWVNKNKYDYIYDSRGNCTSGTYSLWSTDSLIWKLDSRCLYLYDSQGRITSTYNQLWLCLVDSVWDWHDAKKHEFFYNNNGQLSTSIQYSWVGDWSCIEEHQYKYYDTLLTEETVSLINGTKLVKSFNINYNNYYQSGLLYKSEIVWSRWKDSVQNPQDLNTSYFDKGSVVKSTHSDWVNNSWVDDRRIFFSYNSHGDVSTDSTVEMIYDKWTNTGKTVYIYSYETAIYDNPNISGLDVLVSPTPAHENISISLPANKGNCQLKLFSSAGNLIFESLATGNKININVSSYPPGVYYLLIINEHGSAMKPVVIL